MAEENRESKGKIGLELEELTEQILGCAIQVQRHLGPGLLESAYEACLDIELRQAGLKVARQVPVDIHYRESVIPMAYRIDLLVEGAVIVELKTADRLTDQHEAQVLTYLRLADHRIALLINFWRWPLKDGGIRRILNPNHPPLSSAPPPASA